MNAKKAGDSPPIQTDATDDPGGPLYANPRDALKAVRDDYLYWTAKLTDSSFSLSAAVIGANWAIFGAVDRILKNSWSKWSVIVVIVGLVISLLAAKEMGELHRKRIEYAEEDPDRWKKEFQATLGRKDPWPFSDWIEKLGRLLRVCRTWIPILGGILFLIALFTGPEANDTRVNVTLLGSGVSITCPEDYRIGPFVPARSDQLEGKSIEVEASRIADALNLERLQHRLTALLLIGSTDKRELKSSGAMDYGSNAGLAQDRALSIKDIVKTVIEKRFSSPLPTTVVLSTGPSFTVALRHLNKEQIGQAYAEDRNVQICAVWGS